MIFTRWLRSAFALHPTSARRRPSACRLGVERLEDRLTPSTGGALDPTFGAGGHDLNSFTNNYDAAYATTVQPDGKIVIVGQTQTSGSRTGNDFLVARYNADGTLDTTFGSGGHTATDLGSSADSANAVALQPQTNGSSKIVVAGHTISSRGDGEFAVTRYNANGTLDTTFGSKGKVVTDLGAANTFVQSMVVDSAGRILVSGYTATGAGYVAVLVRYTTDGALDTTFGSGGKLITSIPISGQAAPDSLALQPDGKIVLAGTGLDPATSTPEFVVARFNTNGTTDTGFGAGGIVKTHVGGGDSFGGLAVQGDGKIVIDGSESTGYAPPALYLLRYNTDGTLDTTFGSDGIATVASPGRPTDGGINAHGSGLVLQSDGKIVAGGQYYDSTAQQEILAALRVNPDGSVDTGYGNGGWATVQFASNDSLQAIALEPDGRLLLAGYARPTSTGPTEVALFRFLESAPQVGSFVASPNPVTSGDSTTLTASNISDGNPGATITQVAFYLDSNNDGTLEPGTDTLLGYATQTSPGVWTFTYTVNLAPGTYTLFSQAEDGYGIFGDADALTLTVQ